ncbi:MAG: hypothetical protein ABR584_10450 [Candidatus Baltobacteraceae bacterium]
MRLFAAGLFLLCTLAPAYAQTARTQAETVYMSAIGAMSSLKEPPFVTYTMRGEPRGFAVDLFIQNHFVWLDIHEGDEPSLWQVRHRTDDYASELLLPSGTRYVSRRSFFDPTWFGAFRALRDGMLNYQDVEMPVSSRATPPPEVSSNVHEIAVINVIGPTIYWVEDRGAAVCPNGAPAHALHLRSRDRDPRHQLNDVMIDNQTMRFCMIRYGIADSFGFHGIVEQHYAQVGRYWVQTDGLLDGTMRVFGISMHHGKWVYRLDDLAFPDRIPSTAFLTPFTQ